MRSYSFAAVYRDLCRRMRDAPAVTTERWQGVDASRDPSMRTRELLNVDFTVSLEGGAEDLDHWRRDCAPNLPFADLAFEERVCGSPLNPGTAWERWPWAASADKFRENSEFNITYAEMMWPQWPRRGNGGNYSGSLDATPEQLRCTPIDVNRGLVGVSGERYGDLQDFVDTLIAEPMTRQAWIPLFHPDETRFGARRRMCSLGYQVIVRNGEAHLWYPLRSCDLVRHFRDDCYMAVRFLLWVMDRCRERNPAAWDGVRPGTYAMHCTSLHIFENDTRSIYD